MPANNVGMTAVAAKPAQQRDAAVEQGDQRHAEADSDRAAPGRSRRRPTPTAPSVFKLVSRPTRDPDSAACFAASLQAIGRASPISRIVGPANTASCRSKSKR